MSSSSFSPSSGSTASSTPAPTTSIGGSGGAPATATLLFGFLVIFAALFAAFLFLVFFWKIQQRRRSALGPEIGEIGGVPKLWEVWIRDEASENQSNWESASPLAIDAVRLPSEEAISPTSRGHRPWPCSLFRRRAVPPPPSSSQAQQQLNGLDAEGLINGGLRVSFVIAMPHADTSERRQSQISRTSQVMEQQNWRRREYAIGIYHPSFRDL